MFSVFLHAATDCIPLRIFESIRKACGCTLNVVTVGFAAAQRPRLHLCHVSSHLRRQVPERRVRQQFLCWFASVPTTTTLDRNTLPDGVRPTESRGQDLAPLPSNHLLLVGDDHRGKVRGSS